MSNTSFPVLSKLLREDVEDDIAAGLKAVISDIRSGWGSSFKSVERVHKNNLKRLQPEQRKALRGALDKSIETKIGNPKALLNVSSISSQINTPDEATTVLTALMAIAVGVKEIDVNFINNCRDVLTPQEAALFMSHAKDQRFTELPIGQTTLDFIAKHRTSFESMLDLNDDLVVDVQKASSLLRQAINQTPIEGAAGKTRQDAALGVHYFLHHVSATAHSMYIALVADLKGRNLVTNSGKAKIQKSASS